MLFLPGCAQISGYMKQAETIADDEVVAFEYGFCRGARVMAWFRRYGGDPVKAAAWRAICVPPITDTPALPAPLPNLNAPPKP